MVDFAKTRIVIYGTVFFGGLIARLALGKCWPIVAVINRAGAKAGQNLGRSAGHRAGVTVGADAAYGVAITGGNQCH